MSGSAAQKATKPVWSYMRTNVNVSHPWRIDPRWSNPLAEPQVYRLTEAPQVGAQWRRFVFPVTFVATFGCYVACYNETVKQWFNNPATFNMTGVKAAPVQVAHHYNLPVANEDSLKATLNLATGRKE